MSWSSKFDEPIPTDGKPLVTLRDAANYVLKLPASKQKREPWQTAMGCLLWTAENGLPPTMARIAMLRAINEGRIIR